MNFIKNLFGKRDATAENLLAEVRKRIQSLLAHLSTCDDQMRFECLLKHTKNITLNGNSNTFSSYVKDKEPHLTLCLRTRTKFDNIAHLTHVAIHLLAHVMTNSLGVTTEFLTNRAILLAHAHSIGITTEG